MPRTFTTVSIEGSERRYTGFNFDFSRPMEVDHVVLYTVDGEISVAAVDNPGRVSDLMAFISEEVSETGQVKVLGIYSRR